MAPFRFHLLPSIVRCSIPLERDSRKTAQATSTGRAFFVQMDCFRLPVVSKAEGVNCFVHGFLSYRTPMNGRGFYSTRVWQIKAVPPCCLDSITYGPFKRCKS